MVQANPTHKRVTNNVVPFLPFFKGIYFVVATSLWCYSKTHFENGSLNM
jgi:hypothetical protein